MSKRNLIPIFLICGLSLSAQIDYSKFPKVTDTYFINDVHIQKSPTDSFGLGDIIIKDGKIDQIGKELSAPIDAYVVEADSAYAYPCFIDALSHLGIPKGEDSKERPKIKFRGHPPNKVAGISPEIQAVDVFDGKNEGIKSAREAGFGIIHSVPSKGMLPGQGAIFSLGGNQAEDMILRGRTSTFFQFKTASGVYPSTIIGVMAKWRDLYNSSKYFTKNNKTAATSSSRQKTNKTLEALSYNSSQNLPVFTKATKAKTIHRALALQKEMGYKMVIADVRQGEELIPKLRSQNVPVLLSAKLPKELKDEKKKKKDDEKEESEEMKALKERQKKSYNTYLAQAAAFEKAGIKFGFSFLSNKHGDIKKALNRMIKAGLSQSTAIAALTINPASILGIDGQVGTLAPGKMGNIFITTKPYFDKESKVKFSMVDGDLKEYEIKKKEKGADVDEEAKKKFVGTWAYTVETPMGEQAGKLMIKDEDGLQVSSSNDEAPDDITECENVAVDGNTLTYSFTVNMGQELEIDVSVEVDGESMEGTCTVGEFGSFPLQGSRISKPE